MAIAPVRVILFLLGGTVAAGITAYVAGVFDGGLGREETVGVAEAPATAKVAELPPAQMEAQPPVPDTAAQPPAAAETPAESAAPAVNGAANPPAQEQPAQEQPKTAGAATAESEAAPPADAKAAADEKPQELASLPQEEPAMAEAKAGIQPPSFDIVRVESDGSIVIAGRAAANAKVEAVIGSRIIGTTTAGADGNFAIVLDDPLKPGDYQIVLRATSPDGVVATSTETAVVSIPDSKDGQVLALVEEPGKPAELITLPEPRTPEATAKPEQDAAGDGASDAKPAAAAAASSEGQPTGDAAAAETSEPAADQPAAAEQAAGQQSEGAPAVPAGEEQAAATPPAAAREPAAEQSAAAGAEDPAAADAEAQPAASEESASAKQDRVGPKVTVEAVEIEGRRIYIAGAADPGRLLRAYANEMLLGETRASAAGRFLIEAERDLAVGDYVIRVDALEPDGAKVVARAAVPFEREPGENIAAVAPAADPAGKPAVAEDEAAAKPAPAPVANPAPKAEGTEQEQAAAKEPGAPAAKPAAEAAPAVAEAAAPEAPATAEEPVARAANAPAPAAEELAPKLQPVDSAVIIRRGDTLWRISHRVYGRGIRYSTIYLANQDQIRDPDLILPGQVFKVPDHTSEGESADLSKMGEQAVEPPSNDVVPAQQ